MIDDLFQAGTDQALDDRVARAPPPPPKAPEAAADGVGFWSLVRGEASRFGALHRYERRYEGVAARGLAGGFAKGIAGVADILGGWGQVMGAYPEALGMGYLTDEQQAQAHEAREKLRNGIDYSSPAGDIFRARSAELLPDPVTAHWSDQLVGGAAAALGNVGFSLAGSGPLAPLTFGLTEGLAEADKLKALGVDLATRTKAATAYGAVQGATIVAPVVGRTVLETAGLVAAAGPGAFAATNAAEQTILRHAGYDKIAQSYDPYDPWGLAAATLFSTGIGVAAHALRVPRAAAAVETKAPPADAGTGGPAATATLVRNADGSYSLPETPGRGQPPLRIAGPKTEAAVRDAVQLTPAEQATSDAFERSAGNLRELDAAIKAEKNPQNRAILVAERERLATEAAVKADPDLVDAARVRQTAAAADAARLSRDGDMVGLNEHVAALERAVDQLSNGERVDVSAELSAARINPEALTAAVHRALPDSDGAIEARFAETLLDHEDAKARYAALKDAKGGKVLNTDVARELSIDYLQDRTRSAAVHEPASAFIKRLYAEKLKEIQLNDRVVFTSGGTGAGKSSAVDSVPVLKKAADGAPIIYDTNMNTLASAKKKIDQALAAGAEVHIFHVMRDPVEALRKGAFPRAMRQEGEFGSGRTVPLVEHANTHRGSAKVIQQLAEFYKDNGRVQIRIIDNTRGAGQAALADLGFVRGFDYNGLEGKLNEAREQARNAGEISESVYHGTAPAPVPEGMGGRDGASHGQGAEPVGRGPPEAQAGVTEAKASAVAAKAAFDAVDREAVKGGQFSTDDYWALAKRVSETKDEFAQELGKLPDDGFALAAKTFDGRELLLTPSAKEPGKWQTTRFDRKGEPFGDTHYESKAAAIKEFLDEAKTSTVEIVGAAPPPPAPRIPATGNPSVAITERGTEIPVRWALVEASDLVTSHGNDLAKNAAYPAELQPRDRGRAASEQQIASIENAIKPQLLGESPKASDGAPIVGQDGVVESGNARTIALRRAYAAGKADHYKAWLEANAGKVGLEAKAVAGMKQPVLVRVSEGGYDRAEFARQANEAAVATMSQTEQAKADAGRMPNLEELVANDDGTINVAQSGPFIRAFMRDVVSPAEQGAMMTAGGELSQQGAKRIRDAVFARAYGDPELVAMMAESTDANVKNVLSGMLRAAPRVAQLADLQAAGAREKGDVTGPLVEAVRKFSQLRADGMTVDTFLSQKAMFGDELKPETEQMLRAISADARAPKRVAETITRLVDTVDALGDPRQSGMFDAPDVTDAIRKSTEQAAHQSRIAEMMADNPGRIVRLPDGEELPLAEAMRKVEDDYASEAMNADLATVAADCFLQAA